MELKIGIVGHTNSGKTTLIRTLLRRPVGEVDDRANVTQLSESQEFKDFYANLIDTPGFQNASVYLAFLKMREKYGAEAAQTIKGTISLDYEEEIANTITHCDICIYVASLEFVPDEALLAEVNLVSSLCQPTIMILNKNRDFSRKESKDEAHRRKKLWKEGCRNFNVSSIIDYDAHWASPKMNYKLFEEIERNLPFSKRKYFTDGVSAFKSRQKALREESIEYALECIVKCRKIDLSEEIKAKEGESDEEYITRIKNSLTEMCGDELTDFMNKVTSLYALAAELPTKGINHLGDFDPFYTKGSKIGIAAAFATVIGIFFGIAGALVGLVATSVTVGSAVSVGSAVGGGLGAIVGFSGASTETEKLQAIQSGYVTIICLNTLWLLSCYGWGKGATVPKDMLRILDERTKEVVSGIDPINWDKASSDEMKSWIIRFLDRVVD